MMAGCFNGTHDFKLRFGDVHGLKKGDPVYFQESVIGEVEAVEYTDAGLFLVSVALQKEFAPAATDASRYYIDSDRERREQKLVRVVQMKPGGEAIEEGAIVDGHTKYAVRYEELANELGKSITILESGISAFLKELQSFPADGQIEALERQLDDLIADLGNMSSEMKHTLEQEILPLLKEKIEALRKQLAKSGKEEDLKDIDRKMNVIDDRLDI
jgi:ABC-type transporter Mla subunit MlaD